MSTNWIADIAEMQGKYGVHKWILSNPEKCAEFLRFRLEFLKEELQETESAIASKDPEEIVDGLIDLCVVAIGTLDAFNIDSAKAWDDVLHANMQKMIGVKPSRPNRLGVPDLVKPEGWVAPDHSGNHGLLPKIFDRDAYRQLELDLG